MLVLMLENGYGTFSSVHTDADPDGDTRCEQAQLMIANDFVVIVILRIFMSSKIRKKYYVPLMSPYNLLCSNNPCSMSLMTSPMSSCPLICPYALLCPPHVPPYFSQGPSYPILGSPYAPTNVSLTLLMPPCHMPHTRFHLY